MTAHEQLIAYLATLATLVIALVGSMVVAALVPGVLGHVADFGIGTVTGGLIGVLRIPSSRTVTVDNPPNSPVPVEPQP